MLGNLLEDILFVATDKCVVYKDGQYGQLPLLMAEVYAWVFCTLRETKFEEEFIELQVPNTRGLLQPVYALDLIEF